LYDRPGERWPQPNDLDGDLATRSIKDFLTPMFPRLINLINMHKLLVFGPCVMSGDVEICMNSVAFMGNQNAQFSFQLIDKLE
jgi:hypothetical protein